MMMTPHIRTHKLRYTQHCRDADSLVRPRAPFCDPGPPHGIGAAERQRAAAAASGGNGRVGITASASKTTSIARFTAACSVASRRSIPSSSSDARVSLRNDNTDGCRSSTGGSDGADTQCRPDRVRASLRPRSDMRRNQGCCRACAALHRRGTSRRRRAATRSRASDDTKLQARPVVSMVSR